MTSSLVISNFQTGYETDRTPFNINNDAFPILNNAFVWRGRVRKKRGTSLLGRLQVAAIGVAGVSDGSKNFTGNLVSIFGWPSTSSIVPGTFHANIGGSLYTEPNPPNGTLLKNGVFQNPPSTINYATGSITLLNGGTIPGQPVSITAISFYPNLPVMGLEDFEKITVTPVSPAFPVLVAFDTRYSYQINQLTDTFYNVTFYKLTGNPFLWTGTDYQQFWSANWAGALWVTNNQPGFQFSVITAITNAAASLTLDFALPIAVSNLTIGDKVLFLEVQGAVVDVNGKVGTITANGAAPAYTATFDTPVTVNGFTSGIVQVLTNSVTGVGNGIKFYNGDPTGNINQGWVNFAPPLSNSITPQYLIGAKIVIPFKNRLLFFGVWLATSAAPGGVFYPNRMVYSEDGTPYYNSITPVNQTFDIQAWYQNIAGFGGFLGAPLNQEIITVQENDDVLLTGYETKQLKLLFTGDDSLPFVYQTINSELGSESTFSGISLDTGALSIGSYGIALTTQVSAQRIDLPIPDQVFDISGENNDDQRVTAIRDYRNEFVYFTYCPSEADSTSKFNTQTLLYNYRDNTWAILFENFTHYGTFRRTENLTWATLNRKYKTWSSWTDPWNFGGTAAKYPNIIGGNQQGFVMIKDDGTYEDNSQYISDIDTSTLIVTSPNHCLKTGDYIEISGALGVANVNDEIFQIRVLTFDTFTLILSTDQEATPPSGTYLGAGIYRRLSNLNVQTKQFPIFWEQGRQSRIGVQRFFMQNASIDHITGPEGLDPQVTVNIFTNQNDNYASNDVLFRYLISSNILLTGPEPGKPAQADQQQIWHRLSNSFNGDTVQIGFTLSDAQMRDNNVNETEITIHAIAMELYPGPLLS